MFLKNILSEWKLVEEKKTVARRRDNPLSGMIDEGTKEVDLFRKKKWNGLYKYKTVDRF